LPPGRLKLCFLLALPGPNCQTVCCSSGNRRKSNK